MGEFYERLQPGSVNRIPIHYAESIMGAWGRAEITGAQAQAMITAVSGTPLGATGVTEVNDLKATIPAGATTQNQLDRLARVARISQTFMNIETQQPPYNDLAFVRTLLGVPTR